MKKIICLLAAVVLVISCVAMNVAAVPEPSPETDGVISGFTAIDKNGDGVSINISRTKQPNTNLNPTGNDEVSLGQYDIEIIGNPKYPVTIRTKVAGVKKGSSTVRVMAQGTDGNVVNIDATITEDGEISFVLEKEYSKLSIITDKATATKTGVSDKTGDNLTDVFAVVLVLSAVCAVVAYNKVKA